MLEIAYKIYYIKQVLFKFMLIHILLVNISFESVVQTTLERYKNDWFFKLRKAP